MSVAYNALSRFCCFCFFLLAGASALNPKSISSVQDTSLLVAYWRDLETRYAQDPLIKDEPANALLTALLSTDAQAKFESSSLKPFGWDMLAVRTRIIDDWWSFQGPFEKKKTDTTMPLQQHIRQIVNLGCGICCRPYRLDIPHMTNVFEVEIDEALLHTKHKVLEEAGFVPKANIISVPIDLAATSSEDTMQQLQQAGLDPGIPIDWLAEGLFAYLDPETEHASILQLGNKNSRMAITIFEPPCRDLFESHGVLLPWKELVPVERVIEQALEMGWKLDRHICGKDWDDLYGRGADLPGYSMIFLEWDG